MAGLTARGALMARLQPTEGTGQLLVSSGYSWGEVVNFTGPKWNIDGRTPVYWNYAPNPVSGRGTLTVVAAPGTQVTRKDILSTTLPKDVFPGIFVIRAQSADLLPEPDTPLLADEVVGRPEWVINGYDPATVTPTVIQEFMASVQLAPDVFKAMVRPRANGVTIAHALRHWQVAICVPWDEPAAFAWEIVHPVGIDPFDPKSVLFGASHFHLRVVRTSNVVIEGFTARELGDDPSTLLLEEATVGLTEVPPQGTDLSRGYMLRPLTDLPLRYTPETLQLIAAAEFAVGLIPVVGTVVDVAHVTYQAATGQTFWGEEVTPNQVVANGVFALLGCVADTKEAAEILIKISDRLYPGVKLVTRNPGFLPDVKALVRAAANAYAVEAVERMASAQYDLVLHTLDDFTAGRTVYKALGTVVDEVLNTKVAETVASGVLPDSLLRESFSWIHPANFATFEDLPLPKQQTIVDAYRSVVVNGKPASDLIDRFEPDLAGLFVSRLDEWRVGRVMNLTYTQFRSRLAHEGFVRFQSQGGKLNAVQWAVTQTRGRTAEALTLSIGSDFRKLLRRIDPDVLWDVPPEGLAHFNRLHDQPDFYVDVAKENKRFGHLFQADHGFEYRHFWQPALQKIRGAYDHVMAILVPANPFVARQLPQDKVFYAHSVKTEMLARLIPNGFEELYTLQEVLDAYTIVMVHRLKVPDIYFQGMIVSVIKEAAQVSGIRLDYVIRTEAELLARNPSFHR